MRVVYQILSIECKNQNTFKVELQHITKRKGVKGTISIRNTNGENSMWFRKDGDSKDYEVVGKYEKHNDITFFHSGETQFVYLHSKQDLNLYIDVEEIMTNPFESILKQKDIIVVEYGGEQLNATAPA